MLDGDKVVLHLLGFLVGNAEQPIEPAGDANLIAPARDARQLLDLALQLDLDCINGNFRLVEDRGGQPMLLIEQREQQMLDIHELMIELRGQPIGGLQGFERLFGEAILVHDGVPCALNGDASKPANAMPKSPKPLVLNLQRVACDAVATGLPKRHMKCRTVA